MSHLLKTFHQIVDKKMVLNFHLKLSDQPSFEKLGLDVKVSVLHWGLRGSGVRLGCSWVLEFCHWARHFPHIASSHLGV